MTERDSRDLGSFPVETDPHQIAAFRAALGGGGDAAGVPLTYPMRWFAGPDVRAALLSLVPEADVVPVHESQDFTYLRPLEIGEAYTLGLRARREAAPDRLVVDGVVAAWDGVDCVRCETVLRLISTATAAA